MSVLLGDACYRSGQFDEAIKFYMLAANEGYVEGMEKLLKTCVELGRKHMLVADCKEGLAVWSMASSTLKTIMGHNEISKEVKDRAYAYYEEIMRNLGFIFFFYKFKESLAAFNKINAKGDMMVDVLKAYCEFVPLVDICKDLVKGMEEEGKVFPFVNDGGISGCFERFDILNQLTEKDCKRMVQQLPYGEIAAFSAVLFRLSCIYLGGQIGNLLLVVPDAEKALWCWKMRKIIDEKPLYDIPKEIEDIFEKMEKESAKSASKTKPTSETKKQSRPAAKGKTASVATKRKITVRRPSKFLGWATTAKVCLDGAQVGALKGGETMTYEVDGKEHHLSVIFSLLLDKTEYTSLVPADGKDHTFEMKLVLAAEGALLMDGETKQEAIRRNAAWMDDSLEIQTFLWTMEQLFTPKAMHDVGKRSILEDYDEVWIYTVGYEKIVLKGKSWNNQEKINDYTTIPITYGQLEYKFQLKNAYETEHLKNLLTERIESLPHITKRGISFALKQ